MVADTEALALAADAGHRTVCSFDLAYAITVEACSSADEANLLLQDGWVLLAASIDANGFPVFVLAQPSAEWPGLPDSDVGTSGGAG